MSWRQGLIIVCIENEYEYEYLRFCTIDIGSFSVLVDGDNDDQIRAGRHEKNNEHEHLVYTFK